MKYGLISLLPLQAARILGLMRTVEAVRLDEDSRPAWVLLARGRGFTRILRDEPLVSVGLLRTSDPTVPRPMRFLTRGAAERYAQSVGLVAQQTTWSVKEA